MPETVEKKITSQDQWNTFLRSWLLMGSINLERWQALGYCWTMLPLFKKFYGDNKELYTKALKRNLEFFNTEPHMASIIFGMHMAMMEAGADIDAISGMKVALMGPFAGIGDSLIWGTLRTILEGLAISFALQGSLLAVPVFIVPWAIFVAAFMWFTQTYTYRLGADAVREMMAGGLMKRFTDYAGMVGIAVVGALTASFISITTPISFTSAGLTMKLQVFLDAILPKLIPLTLMLSAFALIRKGNSYTRVMLILFVIGFILGSLNLLAV